MSDLSPIAHEGNPKLDTLTISGGSVLSDASLTIISEYIPIIPDIPPPPPPTGGGLVTCAGVFEWNEERGDVPVIWSDGLDCEVLPTEHYDTELDLRITTGQECYGILAVDPPSLCDGLEDTDWYISLQGAFEIANGSPRFGICAWCPSIIDADNVTCFGLVVDVINNTVGLYYWLNASLEDFGTLPTPLYETAYTAAPFDELFLEVYKFTGSYNGPFGYVYSHNRAALKKFLPSSGGGDLVVSPKNFKKGFLAIGGGGSGTARFAPFSSYDCGSGNFAYTLWGQTEPDIPSGMACTKVFFQYTYLGDVTSPCAGGMSHEIRVDALLVDKRDCHGHEISSFINMTALAARGTLDHFSITGSANCAGAALNVDVASGGFSTFTANTGALCSFFGTGCAGPKDGSAVHVIWAYTPNDPEGSPVTIEFDINPAGVWPTPTLQTYTPTMEFISVRTTAQIDGGCCPCSETVDA